MFVIMPLGAIILTHDLALLMLSCFRSVEQSPKPELVHSALRMVLKVPERGQTARNKLRCEEFLHSISNN